MRRSPKLKSSLQKLAPKADEVGLEIGSGLGIHTAHLASMCKTMHAVDISTNFIDYFRRYTEGYENIARHDRTFFPMLDIIEDESVDFG